MLIYFILRLKNYIYNISLEIYNLLWNPWFAKSMISLEIHQLPKIASDLRVRLWTKIGFSVAQSDLKIMLYPVIDKLNLVFLIYIACKIWYHFQESEHAVSISFTTPVNPCYL